MDTRSRGQRAIGVLTLLGSAMSNQVGAAVGSLAFPVITPIGVVAIRQFVAAAVLLPIVRPRFWRYRWSEWWPVLLLGLVFGTMNLTLYSSIERIGLGLAVTLEFLGPLAIAIAGVRSVAGFACALAAAGGVLALTHPEPSTDFVGVALGLVAAACWAAYILLNRQVGLRLNGVQGAAMASSVSAVVFIPVAIVLFLHVTATGAAIGYAIAAGVLASVVPYVADLVALRRARRIRAAASGAGANRVGRNRAHCRGERRRARAGSRSKSAHGEHAGLRSTALVVSDTSDN